jgi:glyoxylase-like metal-dependent hydrolase (beta-lactamase superfamily II)
MTRILLFILLTALVAGTTLSGCAEPPPAATRASDTAAPVAAATTDTAQPGIGDVLRFRIGALDAVALKDGDIDVANDGKTFGVGQPIDAVSALLAAAGEPTDMLHLSIQPLLVRAGERTLLFDTGAGDVAFARGGHLPAALRAAGVEAAQVTDIFISHAHGDHVGGLLTGGALAFPNATIHLRDAEWAAMQADGKAAALVAAITPKVATFRRGAQLLPGLVTAVAVDGHTPGHTAYEIASGDERLLYIADAAHHSVISVQRPEWTVQFDGDAPLAEASRRALLQRAADAGLRLYAVHFPFPGLGRVEARDDSFVWVPEG